MTEILEHEAKPFCFHSHVRLAGIINRAHGHRSCWGPQLAERECRTCGATVEVKR